MDLGLIINSLDEEAKEIFLHQTATDYYHYLENQKEFLVVQKHLLQDEKLSDKEWRYMLHQLFLVSCRALAEEDKVSFPDEVFLYISKLGMRVSKKNQYIYNECYKMAMFVQSKKWEKEINEDLLGQLDVVYDSHEESDLNRLLKLHDNAAVFRDNQNAFIDAYHDATPGDLSAKEKMYIHSFQFAYQKNKELLREE